MSKLKPAYKHSFHRQPKDVLTSGESAQTRAYDWHSLPEGPEHGRSMQIDTYVIEIFISEIRTMRYCTTNPEIGYRGQVKANYENCAKVFIT